MTDRPLNYIVKDDEPLTLEPGDSVREACRLMWGRRAGSVLVVDADRRLVGIFTGRDAVECLAEGASGVGRTMAGAMTGAPVTVSRECRALDALHEMASGGFRHLPVMDGNTVVGVVSRGDFKGMEFEEYRRRVVKEGISPANRTLGDIVEGQRPLVVAAGDSVESACREMWRLKSGSALVTDAHRHLAGIFTGRDAVRALARLKDPAAARLGEALTPGPVTLPPTACAIDALRAMNDGGFRHIPVLDGARILGVVSRGDFTGVELDRLDEETHLAECIW